MFLESLKTHSLYKTTLFFAMLIILLFTACQTPNSTNDADEKTDTYTVTYDGNNNTSGTVPTDSNTYENGAAVTVLDAIDDLERKPAVGTGEIFKKFDGWNTQADGNGTDYTSSSTFIMGSADVTLYAKWIPYELRDTGPAGGLIFYDKGSFSDGWRYMEAAPGDQSSEGAAWIEGGNTQDTLNGNTSLDIGTGLANSEAIVDQEGHEGSAAEICLDYDDGTYSDWFLPSDYELEAMRDNLGAYGVGGFKDSAGIGDCYWTSSETNAGTAFWRELSSSSYGSASKGISDFSIRAARAF